MTSNTLIFGLLVFLGNIYHLNNKNLNFGLLVSNTKKGQKTRATPDFFLNILFLVVILALKNKAKPNT